jgi:hypothetical protein
MKTLQPGFGPMYATVPRLELNVANNGDINQNFGVYRSVCCGREIIIRKGATFPDCSDHPGNTVWKPVDPESQDVPPPNAKNVEPAA